MMSIGHSQTDKCRIRSDSERVPASAEIHLPMAHSIRQSFQKLLKLSRLALLDTDHGDSIETFLLRAISLSESVEGEVQHLMLCSTKSPPNRIGISVRVFTERQSSLIEPLCQGPL